MSEDKVAVLQRIYDEWAKGNVRAGLELLDPHVVYINRPGLVEATTCYGLEEMQRWMRDFLSAWDEYASSAKEFIRAGDSVVVAVHHKGRGAGSGAMVEDDVFHVWTFRGDMVVRLETIGDRVEALEVAGLSE